MLCIFETWQQWSFLFICTTKIPNINTAIKQKFKKKQTATHTWRACVTVCNLHTVQCHVQWPCGPPTRFICSPFYTILQSYKHTFGHLQLCRSFAAPVAVAAVGSQIRYCINKTSVNVQWIRNWHTLYRRRADALCSLTRWQHFCMWNSVMAAILKLGCKSKI